MKKQILIAVSALNFLLLLFALPCRAESVENLRKFLAGAETILNGFESIKARSSLENPAFCQNEVSAFYQTTLKNMTSAVMYVGEPERVTAPLSAMFTRAAVVRDYCLKTRNDNLKHIPSLQEAKDANDAINPGIAAVTPIVTKIRDDLKKQIQSSTVDGGTPVVGLVPSASASDGGTEAGAAI
jgi:hypothetical protein